MRRKQQYTYYRNDRENKRTRKLKTVDSTKSQVKDWGNSKIFIWINR